MTDPRQLRDDDWEADWEGQRRWQLTAGLSATPAQRLEWLEEMIDLAHRYGALAERDQAETPAPAGVTKRRD